jgi:hypothetical protein
MNLLENDTMWREYQRIINENIENKTINIKGS